MTRILATIIFALLCLFQTQAMAAEQALVRVCGDRDPLSMTPTSNISASSNPTQANLIGFSVDMIRAVFAALGKNVQFIHDLPWKRCLADVESGNIDFAMDAYFDLERAKVFDYSTHYNTLTPQIFFLRSNPVNFSQPANLKQYRGCGLLGTSYAHYGIESRNLDLGINRETMIKKLRAGRCDYFLEELEDIASYKITGVDYLADPTIRHETVDWAVAPSKFLITAKNSRNAKLLEQINAAIYSLVKSGQAEKFWLKTEINLPFKS